MEVLEQWRVQDFSDGGAGGWWGTNPPKWESKPFTLTIFTLKLHEIEKS